MNVLDMTLAQASDALNSQKISSVELVKETLKQIGRMNPKLNAYLRVDEDACLSQARLLDQELARGSPRSLLHGIPLAHKDMFYRAGVSSSCGTRLPLPVPTRTSTVLQRLDAAGAIQMGVLHMSAFAVGPTGHNSLIGDCLNPWHSDRITGGSSSGSASAVAARIAFGAMGSDTAGSIRLPAAMCGITGLKPTYGRVSRAGTMSLSPSLDVVGPLARSAYDCALLMQTIAGPDPQDATTVHQPPVDFLSDINKPVRGWRLGIPTNGFNTNLDPEVEQQLETSAQVFRDLGCELVPVAVPDLQPLEAAVSLVTACEGAAIHLSNLREYGEDGFTLQMRIRLERGLAIPTPTYINILRSRKAILLAFMRDLFDKVDMLLAPAMPICTPTRTETSPNNAQEMEATIGHLLRFTRPVSFLGLPTLVLPMGFDSNRMPLGQQLIGRPFAEAALLRLGYAYQQHTNWHAQSPECVHHLYDFSA